MLLFLILFFKSHYPLSHLTEVLFRFLFSDKKRKKRCKTSVHDTRKISRSLLSSSKTNKSSCNDNDTNTSNGSHTDMADSVTENIITQTQAPEDVPPIVPPQESSVIASTSSNEDNQGDNPLSAPQRGTVQSLITEYCLVPKKSLKKSNDTVKITPSSLEVSLRYCIHKQRSLDPVSLISNLIKNNFQKRSYETSSVVRSSSRLNASNTTNQIHRSSITSTDVLDGYRRCFVEDFMLLDKNDEVLLLVPSDKDIYSNVNEPQYVEFSQSSFYAYHGVISSSPKKPELKAGMYWSDLKHLMNEGNGGNYIKLDCDNISTNTPILIKFSSVLEGRSSGVQVWRRSKTFRDISKIFKNKKKLNKDWIRFLTLFTRSFMATSCRC